MRGEWAALAYLLDEARHGDFIHRLKQYQTKYSTCKSEYKKKRKYKHLLSASGHTALHAIKLVSEREKIYSIIVRCTTLSAKATRVSILAMNVKGLV